MYLLSCFCVPGTVLGTGKTVVNGTPKALSFVDLLEETDNKQIRDAECHHLLWRHSWTRGQLVTEIALLNWLAEEGLRRQHLTGPCEVAKPCGDRWGKNVSDWSEGKERPGLLRNSKRAGTPGEEWRERPARRWGEEGSQPGTRLGTPSGHRAGNFWKILVGSDLIWLGVLVFYCYITVLPQS